MLKSVGGSAAKIVPFIAVAMLLLVPDQRAVAQSAATYINAVELDVVPADREKFLVAIKENGEASVKEPGCQQYIVMFVASNPNHFLLTEVYDNEAALLAHRVTDHFKKYQARVASMITKREVRGMTPAALYSKGH